MTKDTTQEVLAQSLRLEEIAAQMMVAAGWRDRLVVEVTKRSDRLSFHTRLNFGDQVITGESTIWGEEDVEIFDADGGLEEEFNQRISASVAELFTEMAHKTGMLPSNDEFLFSRDLEDEVWSFARIESIDFGDEDLESDSLEDGIFEEIDFPGEVRLFDVPEAKTIEEWKSLVCLIGRKIFGMM